MALQALQSEGILSTGLDLSYETVAAAMRQSQPQVKNGIVWTVALGVVQQLTFDAIAADGTRPADGDWRGFLADQLGRGYPVVAQIHNWHLLQRAWSGSYAHSVVVTGIDSRSVYYIDPEDGRMYSQALSAFATAWATSGDTAVVFTSQSPAPGAPAAPSPQTLLP